MELHGKERGELDGIFGAKIPAYAGLSEEDRRQVLDMAESQARRALPEPFIWASVRSTSELLGKGTEGTRQAVVEQFRVENAGSLRELGNPRTQPRREAKLRARERLLETTRGLLREARSAKQPHERRKMRRMLLGLDQARLLRVLGRDGQELCHQINEYLTRSRDQR